jgi:acyl-CoA dehydrogenase
MKEINPLCERFPEYRQAVRELCRGFNSQYWQTLEERQGYPEEFVKALTAAAGWA